MGIPIIGISLQFFSVFAILLLFNLFLLAFADISKAKYLSAAFMAVGMITNFMDLLTAPLLTLGIPLILYIALLYKGGETRWLEGFKKIFFSSLAWVIGYGLAWASKWALASIILKKNIFKDAFTKILFRTNGNEEYPISRMEALKSNIEHLLEQNGTRIIMIVSLVILAVLAIIFRAKLTDYKNATLLIGIAIFPIVWYLVLANHSSIHYWFTFRALGVSIFASLTALSSAVNTQALSERSKKASEKFRKLINKL
jgi:hypothetical protein